MTDKKKYSTEDQIDKSRRVLKEMNDKAEAGFRERNLGACTHKLRR